MSKPRPLISPHIKAPLFSRPDAYLVFQQIIQEMSSGRFPTTENFRQILRQAGFVNLWFFAKYIAGFAGEYDKLDDDVHVDMCNFRQSLDTPGVKGAMFLPRGVGKSKIVTETGSAWDLLRNTLERIRISNAIADFAQDFMLSIKAIFDSNELFSWLYPEYVPPPNMKRWNDTEIVLPNRLKHSRMASVEYGGVGGAAASHHFTTHICDDPISEQSLNSMRSSNALMEHTRHWFWTNAPSLLDDTLNCRTIVVGTRYAVDDLYDDILKKTLTFDGYPIRGFRPKADGQWRVYYRKIIEDGRIIFPEKHSQQSLDEMAKNDYWTFVTQYLNDPLEAGLAEFVKYHVRLADLDFHDDEWWLSWQEGETLWHEPLSDFDVIMAIDPAATERYITAKTSRSAVGCLATHWSGAKFFIDLRVGFVDPTMMFKWVFEMADRWKKYLRATYIESNAGFKVLGPLLQREANENGIWIGLQPFAAVGEKVARIRSDLDPEFSKKRIFTLEAFHGEITAETEAFPQSSKRDILDMMSAASRMSIQPASPEERAAADDDDEWFRKQRHNQAGY